MTLKERLFDAVFDNAYEFKKENVIPQCEQIAEDFAIGFAFYLSDNYISRTLDTWDDAVGIRFATKEVLEIYKKEKGL